MALSTTTELKAALATFSQRTDQTSNWGDFITLAEAQMERSLRVRPMLLRSDATVNEEFEDFPSDMIEPVSFILTTTDPVVPLDYIDPRNLNQLKFGDALIQQESIGLTGIVPATPLYYTVVGPQFQFFPAPDTSYTGELTYYQRLPPLSVNAQNWLLYRHPDAYLYGALVQFAIYSQDERLSAWTDAYTTAIAAIVAAYPNPTNKITLRTEVPLRRRYFWNR